MTILFPSDSLDEYRVDEHFREQRLAARSAGLSTALLDYAALSRGTALEGLESPLLVRGWMLSVEQYDQLHQLAFNQGQRLLTSPAQYRRCHWLPGWLELALPDTPETVVCADLEEALFRLDELHWDRYFVKDFVKSNSAGLSPIVTDAEQLRALVEEMLRYRDRLEGGLCLRRVEPFQPESECRSFIWRGQPHPHWGDERDAILARLAKSVDNPFYSADLARRHDGRWRIVELGDGQVSDLKEWSSETLYAILAG